MLFSTKSTCFSHFSYASKLKILVWFFLIILVELHASIPNKKLIVGLDNAYPPYEFINEAGKPDGFNADLLHELSAVTGLEFTLRSNAWSAILKDFDAGKIDIIIGMIHNDDRSERYRFSIPHTYIHYNLFYRKQEINFTDWSDLSGKEILVQEGDVINDVLAQKGIDYSHIGVENYSEALKYLSEGQGDASILPWIQGNSFIKENAIANLEYSTSFNYAYPYCIAVKPEMAELIPVLDDAIRYLQKSKKLSKLKTKWLMQEPVKPVRLLISRRNAYLGLGLMSMMALILILSVIHYNRKVKQKTAEYKSLILTKSKTLSELKAVQRLFAEGPIVVLKWQNEEQEKFSYVSENIRNYNYTADDFLSGEIQYNQIIHPDDLKWVLRDKYEHLSKGEFSYQQIYRIACPSDELKSTISHSDEIILKQLNPYLTKANSIQIKWVLDHTTCFYSEELGCRVYHAYMLDITEQQLLNAEVNKNRLIAEDAAMAKDLFMIGISNEMKIPITHLFSQISKARTLELSENQIETLNRIFASTSRLDYVLDQIQKYLNYMQPEFHLNRSQITTIDMKCMIMEKLMPRAAAQNIGLDCDIPDRGQKFLFDSLALQDIILITFDNSLKFTPHGKIDISLNLIPIDDKTATMIYTISDSGIGIPKDKIAMIFEPFTQFDNSFSRVFGGLGIGLSTVKRILELTDGEIIVRSEGMAGSEFILTWTVDLV